MKFRFSPDFVIDSDAEPFCREGLRIGNLGGPGSGKSHNNALLIEQFLTQGGTVVIFQPRDEYYTLKEKFDILSVGGVHAKDIDFALTSPATYAKAVVENGISMIFYTSDVEDEDKLVDWVSRFFQAIMKLEEVYHRPLMVIPEESHEYLPNNPKGHVCAPWTYNRMIKAFKDLSTQGRKLNIIAVVSSQRPQEVNFTIRQLCNVTFYGKFGSQDIKYIDKECLTYVRKLGVEIESEKLVQLSKGEWLVIQGSQSRFIMVTEPRLTKHGADTPNLEYVAPRASAVKQTVDDLAKSIMDALAKEQAEGSELEKIKRKLRDMEKKLEESEKKANIKLNLQEMMKPSAPAPVKASINNVDAQQLKDLQGELEEFRSGRKLPGDVKQRIDLVEADKKNLQKMVDDGNDAHNDMCQELFELQEKLRPFNDFVKAFVAILPVSASAGVPALGKEEISALLGSEAKKMVEEFKKAAEDAAKREMVKYAAQDGAATVAVTECIPEIQHKIERPVVQTDEKTRDGQFITMALRGFFDQERRVPEIAKELDRWYIFSISKNVWRDLSPYLEKLVKLKVLQRKEAGSGWVYLLADGAKDRIKEAA